MQVGTRSRLAAAMARRDGGFRWRGTEVSRIEGLSDAVFGFAVTLLVVSLEAPRTFAQLHETMRGFGSFALCFLMLLTIWHAQYLYFRRYALDDVVSFVLNAALLFVVAFYVYPMRFLFTTFVDAVMGVQVVVNGVSAPPMGGAEWRELMLIYSSGFAALYLIFSLLYAHARRMGDVLELDPVERSLTRASLHENVGMLALGVVSLCLAALNSPSLAGMTYILIGPMRGLMGWRHGKALQRIRADFAVS